MSPEQKVLQRVVVAGAWYDLLVTLPFATPWGAKATLGALATLHGQLGWGGMAPPLFLPGHLLFVAFFGTIVVIWSLVRIVFRRPVDGAADTIGRVAFAAWMGWALVAGGTHIIAGMLVLELGWGVAQGWAYWRFRRDEARSAHADR